MINDKMTSPLPLDNEMYESLRPILFDDFIGQTKLKNNLKVYTKAALKRQKPLDHTLFYGPPGLGKTTLCHILATEMKQTLKVTSAPNLEKQGDLMALLTNLKEGDLLFIDEIHRLRKVLEEILYSAMEDFKVDIIIGEGTGAKILSFKLPPFTLVGATTKSGSLSSPLRARFGITERLNFYLPQELEQIVIRSAHILNIDITKDAALSLGKASRGTPRIANRLLKRISDFAVVEDKNVIDSDFCNNTLSILEIDDLGLDQLDRKFLKTMHEFYHGGPVGIKTLAVTLSEEVETLEDVVEPFLIQKGFIKRTAKGRILTSLAYQHLGIKAPLEDSDLTLF